VNQASNKKLRNRDTFSILLLRSRKRCYHYIMNTIKNQSAPINSDSVSQFKHEKL